MLERFPSERPEPYFPQKNDVTRLALRVSFKKRSTSKLRLYFRSQCIMSDKGPKGRTAFVSGHTDLSQEDFDQHYIPQLDRALEAGDNLLLGDATGVDTQALTYLLSPEIQAEYPNVKSRIIIYASKDQHVPALKKHGVHIISPKDPSLAPTPEAESIVGFENKGKDRTRFKYTLHDAHLTLLSDYDILYARTEAEAKEFYGSKYRPRLSATEGNRRRREILIARRAGKPDPIFEMSVWDDGSYVGGDDEQNEHMMGELPGV